ncbi:MAG: stalk domain-containing protein [Paenibacillaceae bacterium]
MSIRVKLLTFMVALITLLSFCISASASTIGTDVTIKSSVLNQATFNGQIINNRTYVNLIGLLYCLPYLVNSKAMSFNAETKTLNIYSNDFASNPTPLLQFHVGDDFFYAGKEKIKIDTKILLVNNRIYIPLKPITTYYNLNVTFNQKNKSISVTK